MASTEEVLKALQNAKITTLAATEPEELVIDAESRTITVPSSERLFGVTGDMNIERKYFRCPKIVGDNVDLSTHQIFIAYVYTETESGSIFPSIGVAPYHCEDVEVDGEDITFSWKLTGNVFKNPGFILFKMYAKRTEADPNTVFNTTPAIGTVLATIPDGTEEIVEEHPDVIAQIFDRLDTLESGGGGGTGGTTNYEKLSNKPKLNGVTLEGNKTLDQVGVLAKNQGPENKGKSMVVGKDGALVPENVKVNVDSTLSNEGQAADAKVTGEALANKAKVVTDLAGNKYNLKIKDDKIIWEKIYEEVKSDYLLDFDVRGITVTDEVKQYYTEPVSKNLITMNEVKIENTSIYGILNGNYEVSKDWPIDFSEGYSIEMAYRCKPTSGWYDVYSVFNQAVFRRHSSSGFIVNIPYYTNTELKTVNSTFELSSVENENGTKLSELINESTDIIYAVVTVSPTCEIKVYINGYLCKEINPPEDFIKHVDNLTKNTITNVGYYMRFGNPVNNMPDDALFSYAKITKSVLQQEDILNNYRARYGALEANSMEIKPGDIQLYPYSQLPIEITIYPTGSDYSIEAISENYEIAKAENEYTKIKAINIGKTNVTYKINGTDIKKSISVEVVESLKADNIDSMRSVSPEKIVVVNAPESLYVGDSWVLLGYLLPYEPKNDNLIVYTSDNPEVCSVEFGVLTANSKGTSTITAKGLGTEISTTFVVKVSKKIEEVSTLSNTYYVPLPITTENGFLDPNNDHAEETTRAIIDLLAWAKEKGYRKIVFPKGEYLVTPEVSEEKNGITGSIFMPDNMIVDFSESIINVKPTDISKDPGYTLFAFDGNIKNTILCNADIRGDRYTNTTEALDEQCKNIYIRGAIECGVENCSIGNCGGFNIGFGRTAINNVSDSVGIYNDNVEAGTFTETGEKDNVNISNNWRTINKLNISPLHGYFELGTVWGYAGYPIMARLYDMWIYNQSNELLEVKHNCRVFYRYDLPDGYYYADVVLHQPEKPSGNLDSGGMIRFYSLYEPYKCFMKNCKIHDNYSCGIAACGGKHWTLDGLTFENNGVRDPSCHVDYEDGWESAVGDVWKNCKFDNERGGGIILVSGNSATFFNNEINCKFDPRVRSEGWRLFCNKIYKSISGNCQTDTVVAQNLLFDDAVIADGSHYHGDETEYKTRIFSNYQV